MRGRWDHEAPEGHQPAPRDNTSRYIYAQVSRWLRTDEPVHPESAMEVASWWMSPGEAALTAMAQQGFVAVDGMGGWGDMPGDGADLSDSLRSLRDRRIARHPQEAAQHAGEHAAQTLCLHALIAYVDAVTAHATRYRQSIWYGGGHRWMSTGEVDEDSCLTCGVTATLRPETGGDGDYGCYYGGDGELIIACTGRTDLSHGYERLCEGATGRGCDAWRASGGEACEHVNHTCNCNYCN